MKHGELVAIAHNLADSMSSGIGLMIGFHPMNIYHEAAKSPDGHITIDMLTGAISGGPVSPDLKDAFEQYRVVMPQHLARHGAEVEDFAELVIRFSVARRLPHFRLTVRDQRGKQSVTEYAGNPAKRVRWAT
jgi:hypothetical protein